MQNQDFPSQFEGFEDVVPFATAEEAWIWGVKGVCHRLDGAHVLPGMADVVRPCEASDVVNCADRLHRDGLLTRSQLSVILLYGRYAVPPTALGGGHRRAVPEWSSAMRTLEQIFETKGIIERGQGDV